MRFSLTSDRAGVAWLGLLALSLVAFPWYKGASLWTGPAASALVEALSGRGWIWPLIAMAVATITSASYLGSRMEYVVQDENLEFLFSRPISEPRHKAGDKVILKIDPADLILVS